MRPGNQRRQSGIAYLGVLLAITAIGIGAMQTSRLWRTVQQRALEAELLFVGEQLRQAIGSYYHAGSANNYPSTLEDLLKDKRSLPTLRHLRRLYADPLSGKADWGLISTPGVGITGVYSRAAGIPLKQQGFSAQQSMFAEKQSYKDWEFSYVPANPGATR